MIKRIDRYIIAGFVPPFILCLLVVYGLFAAFDMLQSLNDLLREEGENRVTTLLTYYVWFFPVFVADLAPGALLISGGLVIVGMSRRREILTLKASGTSLHRVTAPMLIVTALISLGIFWLKEDKLPELAVRCDAMKGQVKQDMRLNVLLRDERRQFYMHIEQYDMSKALMDRVFIVYRYPDGKLKETLQAREGRWNGRAIALSDVVVHRFRADSGLQAGPPEKAAALAVPTSLRARDVERAEQIVATHFNLSRLRSLIREQPGIPAYRVMYHGKLSAIFAPLILLVLGIPLISGSDAKSRSRFLGTSICIAVSALFYIMTFVCTNMGNAGMISPVLAGWLPTITLGSLGLILFDQMET